MEEELKEILFRMVGVQVLVMSQKLLELVRKED
jgi:hypothetical protein